MSERKGFLGNIDWITTGIFLALVAFGWVNIYSSEFTEGMEGSVNMAMSHGKQIIWIGVSLVIAFLIILIDFRVYHTLAYFLYAAALALLVITIFIGKEVSGAKGWLVIGGFQLQTAELAKLATILALSKFVSEHDRDVSRGKDRLFSFLIIFLPSLLVLLQNDTGSAMVFASLVFVLFRHGLSAWYIVIPIWLAVVSVMVLMMGKVSVFIFLGVVAAIGYFIVRRSRGLVLAMLAALILSVGVTYGVDFGFNHFLKEYQKERIDVLIGKEVDKKGAGYNVHQSLIAIGSGGLTGKGFLDGTQTKFNFVPEQSTDFIFCTVGEEYGFMGSSLLVLLYLYLFYRLILIAERQKFPFNRAYAYGVLSIFFFHFTINLGMTLGLFPVIGIPLPFISYGGSSLIVFTTMLFILLKLDAANRDY